MRLGLFIPCYINQFYPSVGIATVELLEKLDLDVTYPVEQTCCGQPMANAGYEHLTKESDALFHRLFGEFDYVVSPSGSCVLHLKEHLTEREETTTAGASMGSRVYELAEFLVDVVKLREIPAAFPHRVGLHQGCHGQRGLGLAQMSELVAPPFNKTEQLLRMVKGIELVPLSRPDECCGFGGTFCVSEEAVSVKMGKDRVADHLNNGAEFITSNDMSCLMHLEGILRRNKSTVNTIHIAEILNGSRS